MIKIKNLNTGEICFVDDKEWKHAATEGGLVNSYKRCKNTIMSEEYEEV